MNNKMMKIAKKAARWIKRHIYLIPVVIGSIFIYVSFAAFASFENDPSNKNSIIEKSLATTNQIEITETTSTTNTIVTTTRTTTSTTTNTATITTTEINTTSTVIEVTEEVTTAAIVEETTEAYIELQTEVVDTTNSNYDETINNSSDSEEVAEMNGEFYPSDLEYIWLCNLVAREYGSDYVSTFEKAKVVAVVMNRVNSDLYPNTIYEVITQPYQFSGFKCFDYYASNVTEDVKNAVNYYFNNRSEFGSYMYFEGDGTWNYFH